MPTEKPQLALENANEDLLQEIAGRRQAEEALRRSEAKFRTLYYSTSDAIMLLDGKGFFDCNPAALAIFGCANREEFCSKHPADLSPPAQPDGTDSRTLANQQIATAMEKGRHHFQWMHQRADTGKAFPTDVLLSAMELDGKRVIQATVRDITKLKQAQEAVNRAHEIQRAIFDSTADFIWAVEAHGFELLTFNHALRDYFLQQRGIRIHVGQRPEDLFPNADHIERWRGYYQRALASGPFTTEYLAYSGKVSLLLSFNLLKNNGAIFGVSVFGKDITERRLMETAIARISKQQQAILDVSPIGISLNKGRIIEWANPAHCAMFDYSPEELHGMDTSALFVRKEDYERVGRELAVQIPQGLICKVENEFKRKNGTPFWCFAQGRALDSGDLSAGVIWMLIDITDRKRAEQALLDSHVQLRGLATRVQTAREEERARLAREIHDVLAQELTSLKIDAALLANLLVQHAGESDQSQAREKLAEMTITADTAIQSVQKIATDLRPMVLDTLGLCAAIDWQAREFQAHTGINCKARLPARDLRLDRDRSTALFRILQESLTNVVRHAVATRVEIHLHCKAGQVVLTIQDNGRGIQECQANAPGAVGLLGMRERAVLLGGQCVISGRPGEGTKVEVRLPLPPTENSEEKPS
jgi:PAS domain S-box-containing protein